MTIIKASDYKLRSDLENYVGSILGLTPDFKADYKIQGTKEELSALMLSDRCSFYGIGCETIDQSGEKVEITNKLNKINRG